MYTVIYKYHTQKIIRVDDIKKLISQVSEAAILDEYPVAISINSKNIDFTIVVGAKTSSVYIMTQSHSYTMLCEDKFPTLEFDYMGSHTTSVSPMVITSESAMTALDTFFKFYTLDSNFTWKKVALKTPIEIEILHPGQNHSM